jgi:putative transposase
MRFNASLYARSDGAAARAPARADDPATRRFGLLDALAFIKARFTHEWLESGGAERPRTGSRIFNRRRGVWQRHFWEHLIRDPRDFEHHVDYIHYNPVKHEHVTCPHAWEYSSFHQWAARNSYEPDWCCACDGNLVVPPSFSDLDEIAMEMGE